MPTIDLRDFSGGLNLRDSLERVATSETPDALNMTLTTRAAARPRNGCTQAVTLPAGVAKKLHYSAALDKWLVQVGDTVYHRPGDLSGSWTALATFTGSSPVAMTDFGTKVVIVGDALSGTGQFIHTWDGTALVNASSTARGACVAVFKNRVWVGSDPGNLSRLWFSNIGNADVWTTGTDFVDIREKDAEAISALAVTSAAGLLAFKRRSAYRVTDATTGAYIMIDRDSGCVGPQALASLHGITYTWGFDGLYAWDGVGRGTLVGDKLRPRFIGTGLALSDLAYITAAAHQGRVFFAYPLTVGGANTRFLELHPADSIRSDYLPASAWIMEHALAQAGENKIASLAVKNDQLYAVLKDSAVMYSMLDAMPGADDGTTYESYYKTPPLTVGGLARLTRCRVYGQADAAATSTKDLRTYLDWQTTVENTFDLTSGLESADGEERIDLWSLGHGDAFQLEFRASGGTGTAELDRLLLDLTPLER